MKLHKDRSWDDFSLGGLVLKLGVFADDTRLRDITKILENKDRIVVVLKML